MGRFYKQLQLSIYHLWKDYYVSYNDLKQDILKMIVIKNEGKDYNEQLISFISKLEKELDKVNEFYSKTEKSFKESYNTLKQQFEESQHQTPRGSGFKVTHQYILQFSGQLENLKDYVILNTKA